MIRLVAAAGLVLSGCKLVPPPQVGDGGPSGGPQAVPPEDLLAARALRIDQCPGSGLLPDVSGLYAVAFETVSLVGGAIDPQQEVVTRYAIAQFCQDEERLEGVLVACALDQSPLRDAEGTCAAQLPSDALIARLGGGFVTGAVDLATGAVSLSGWSETWGLAEGAAPPPEPAGIAEVEAAALVDQDEDGEPGVTVRGNGAVPTVAWVARRTTARFALEADGNQLSGTTRAETAQTILGGPATRLLRGRERASGQGLAYFLRADGLLGSERIDRSGDGLVQCAELEAWVRAGALPAPGEWACQP